VASNRALVSHAEQGVRVGIALRLHAVTAACMTKTVLVVGAGFAGAVYARTLAECGWHVEVIDRRPHVAGNAFDEVVASGTRIHRHGPHLFHTNNERVVTWLMRFGTFVPYEHRVRAELPDGRCVPLPVNRQTINAVFDVDLSDPAAVRDFLAAQAEPHPAPVSAADHLHAHIGRRLTDLFFRPYTRKMWGFDLEELDAAVVRRIPLRFDDDDRYFPGDAFQMLPREGYTRLVETILDHPAIHVTLGVAFDRSMLPSYAHCFNSMAIDEYFDNCLGPLPYRSIRFHHLTVPPDYTRGDTSTLNYTDDGPMTRETDWSRLPSHAAPADGTRTITREEPCDYRDNDFERYYPVKTTDGRYDAVYRQYRSLAARDPNLTFIGRCGTYQYLDMHQVINQSLAGAELWADNNR
jgi:UDP-galactopyranose mutase